METSHAENVKMAIARAEIAKKVQTVVQIVLVVNSLMHHQNFHSVQKQNEFVRYA
jgi:hypothetical protein